MLNFFRKQRVVVGHCSSGLFHGRDDGGDFCHFLLQGKRSSVLTGSPNGSFLGSSSTLNSHGISSIIKEASCHSFIGHRMG